mmetsp:Transcript_57782/g.151982  ORF Transcript_57782/g.151982 Transcript_57782/m.151982 type:complete len:405 (-) Transcript_57782:4736-5950(-)
MGLLLARWLPRRQVPPVRPVALGGVERHLPRHRPLLPQGRRVSEGRLLPPPVRERRPVQGQGPLLLHQLRHGARWLHAARPGLLQRKAQRVQRREQRGRPQPLLELRRRGRDRGRRRQARAREADPQLPGGAAPLCGHPHDHLRRRGGPHAARLQQRLVPGCAELVQLERLREGGEQAVPVRPPAHRVPQGPPQGLRPRELRRRQGHLVAPPLGRPVQLRLLRAARPPGRLQRHPHRLQRRRREEGLRPAAREHVVPRDRHEPAGPDGHRRRGGGCRADQRLLRHDAAQLRRPDDLQGHGHRAGGDRPVRGGAGRVPAPAEDHQPQDVAGVHGRRPAARRGRRFGRQARQLLRADAAERVQVRLPLRDLRRRRQHPVRYGATPLEDRDRVRAACRGVGTRCSEG